MARSRPRVAVRVFFLTVLLAPMLGGSPLLLFVLGRSVYLTFQHEPMVTAGSALGLGTAYVILFSYIFGFLPAAVVAGTMAVKIWRRRSVTLRAAVLSGSISTAAYTAYLNLTQALNGRADFSNVAWAAMVVALGVYASVIWYLIVTRFILRHLETNCDPALRKYA
jgi:hypothetical protein